jgi:hypothetical protein
MKPFVVVHRMIGSKRDLPHPFSIL